MNLDILLPVLCLAILSCTLLYSAGDGFKPWAWKQIMYFVCSLFIAIFIANIEAMKLYKFAYLIYGFSLCMLVSIFVFGRVVMGARRWISLGFFNLQPSEFAKVGLVLGMARIFQSISVYKRILEPKLLMPIIMIFLPFGLITLQPDLATGTTVLALGFGICFLNGIRMEVIVMTLGLLVVSLPVAWSLLHDYQKLRVLNFLDPSRDPLGSGYSVTQSKIAIGSGGLFGKGLMKGTQSHLNFLPEHQTDFIFTILAEEFGLIGCLIAIVCYIYIIGYGAKVALRSNSIFCKTIALGSSFIIFMHCFINSAMTMGLLPVAGIPMPLLSYGGSSIVASMICIGLMLHADANRNKEWY